MKKLISLVLATTVLTSVLPMGALATEIEQVASSAIATAEHEQRETKTFNLDQSDITITSTGYTLEGDEAETPFTGDYVLTGGTKEAPTNHVFTLNRVTDATITLKDLHIAQKEEPVWINGNANFLLDGENEIYVVPGDDGTSMDGAQFYDSDFTFSKAPEAAAGSIRFGAGIYGLVCRNLELNQVTFIAESGGHESFLPYGLECRGNLDVTNSTLEAKNEGVGYGLYAGNLTLVNSSVSGVSKQNAPGYDNAGVQVQKGITMQNSTLKGEGFEKGIECRETLQAEDSTIQGVGNHQVSTGIHAKNMKFDHCTVTGSGNAIDGQYGAGILSEGTLSATRDSTLTASGVNQTNLNSLCGIRGDEILIDHSKASATLIYAGDAVQAESLTVQNGGTVKGVVEQPQNMARGMFVVNLTMDQSTLEGTDLVCGTGGQANVTKSTIRASSRDNPINGDSLAFFAKTDISDSTVIADSQGRYGLWIGGEVGIHNSKVVAVGPTAGAVVTDSTVENGSNGQLSLDDGTVLYASKLTGLKSGGQGVVETEANVRAVDSIIFKGAAFENNKLSNGVGTIYGTPTTKFDWEVPSGGELDIKKGYTVTLQQGTTLTNYGTMLLEGTLHHGEPAYGRFLNQGNLKVNPDGIRVQLNDAEFIVGKQIQMPITVTGVPENGNNKVTYLWYRDAAGHNSLEEQPQKVGTYFVKAVYTVPGKAEAGAVGQFVSSDGQDHNIQSNMAKVHIVAKNGTRLSTDGVITTKTGMEISPAKGSGVSWVDADGTISIAVTSDVKLTSSNKIRLPEGTVIKANDEITCPKGIRVQQDGQIILKTENNKTLRISPDYKGNVEVVEDGNITIATSAVIKLAIGKEVVAEGKTSIQNDGTIHFDNGQVIDADGEEIQPEELSFTDLVPDAWYQEAVRYVCKNGLMTGVTDTSFAPDAPMSRAMLWTVLARQDGVNTEGGTTWYSKAMEWAKEKGVSDGSDPDGNITREQIAAMLYRYAGSPQVETDEITFVDAKDVSDYAHKAICWAVEQKIINGKEANRLDPKGNAKRSEVAQMIMKFLERD